MTLILRSPVGEYIHPFGEHPANGIARVTQPFHSKPMVIDGVRVPSHDGIDINFGPGIEGHPLYAMLPGKVTQAGRVSDGAIDVSLLHAGGMYSLEGHMRREIVKVGQSVAVRQQLGELGNTGHTSGAHVHVGFWINHQTVDWWPYLDQNQPTTCHPVQKDGINIRTGADTGAPIFASTHLADNTIRTPAGVSLGAINAARAYGGSFPGGKWTLPDGSSGYSWVKIKFGSAWYWLAAGLAVVVKP